ncbi:MAG: acyl-CoA synthetase [Rickettsiales bacterium]|nr:acyl-CoA synthetase [Rickettsiales bacterium]
MEGNIYTQQLDKNAANHLPLTPLSFLARSALVFPNHISVIHGPVRHTWAQTYARCRSLAHALNKRGIGTGHTVSIIAPNVPAHFEVYFGVPMAGAVINPLNTRLDAPTIAHMLAHSETKLILVERQYSAVIKAALEQIPERSRPDVIAITDPAYTEGELLGTKTYEDLLNEGSPDYAWQWPNDEWHAISLNYTSGTTGNPKGVVYHHRGAYLNAIGNILAFNAMPTHPVYLWTLPMFHASGWCFPWTITAHAGTHVCLRKVEPAQIFKLIESERVTHFTAAPVVLNMLIHAPEDIKPRLGRTVEVMTAGSAPPAPVLAATARMGFNVTHVYGGTEVFGPNMSCAWHEEWNALPPDKQADMKARQGVPYTSLEHMMVADPATMQELPWDAASIGEVMMRGNVVMKGYLKNPEANEAIFKGGWYHTGDLAVRHPDGYIEIKDRLKDIIISGAENICSLDVESVLYRHPAVLEAAVVAKPHDHWGEVVCAFVELKEGGACTEAEMIAFCREHLAHFKCPKHVVFGPLDKTPTGKIQKFVLRERAKAL